jgi:hypothetical protein
MKIKLWSIQVVDKIDEIKSTGKLICLKNQFSIEWDNEYKWMIKQMEKRIGKSEVQGQYPIWAWYQYQDVYKRKPDLRRSGHLPNGANGIRIEFEKNINEVLLSDFVLWHYPLSYKSIIAKNEMEDEKFERKLKKLKLNNANFKDMPIQIQDEIIASWERIFDSEFENKYYTHKKDKKMIHACCWDINESEIVKIDKFKAR